MMNNNLKEEELIPQTFEGLVTSLEQTRQKNDDLQNQVSLFEGIIEEWLVGKLYEIFKVVSLTPKLINYLDEQLNHIASVVYSGEYLNFD